MEIYLSKLNGWSISLRCNDQGAVININLYLRQGVATNKQPRSNKCRQGAANEHQMRIVYEKPNPWSQTNKKEIFEKEIFA